MNLKAIVSIFYFYNPVILKGDIFISALSIPAPPPLPLPYTAVRSGDGTSYGLVSDPKGRLSVLQTLLRHLRCFP